MAEQWFIDETKAHGFIFAVVEINSSDVGRCRADMMKLRAGSPLHFYDASNQTRANAYRTIVKMPIRATIARVPSEIQPIAARERAIRWVAQQAVANKPQRIVFVIDRLASSY